MGLSLLTSSDTWFIDGNFRLASEYFKQLFVFRVRKNSFFITVVYCILECKTQYTYEHLFRTVMNECEKREKYPDPVFLNMDFELAVMNAAKLILSSHTTIRGCFYHLYQSTYRKLQELGLSKRYKKDEASRKFCTMVDSLNFFPLDDVKNGMERIKKNIPTGAEDFIIYFDTTSVNEPFKEISTNKSNIRLRRIPPVFPPCTWNVHQTTVSNDDSNRHRTNNNVTEGWNNRFSHLIGIKNPKVWHLIRKLKYEIASNYAKLALDDVGETNMKTTKLGQMRTTEIKLKELCARFVSGKINTSDFLNSISHNIRKQSNN
ncbi:unnamed protein product [Aphis gossypii]|uniref:MULE transposase domain-containing protein n=1 Tax=Aphis gossypii TaxID=80765 RepID=A0A9P0J5R7_APHGO|nr:unnamed protein product [Aphis gossypii]